MDRFLPKTISSVVFVLGIVLLLLSGVVTLLNHQGLAQKIISGVFAFFVIGTVIYLIEFKKSEK